MLLSFDFLIVQMVRKDSMLKALLAKGWHCSISSRDVTSSRPPKAEKPARFAGIGPLRSAATKIVWVKQIVLARCTIEAVSTEYGTNEGVFCSVSSLSYDFTRVPIASAASAQIFRGNNTAPGVSSALKCQNSNIIVK